MNQLKQKYTYNQFTATIPSALLYATETLSLTVADVQSLEAAHQKCLRQILGTQITSPTKNSYNAPARTLSRVTCHHDLCPLWTCCLTGWIHPGGTHGSSMLGWQYHSTDFRIINGVVAGSSSHQIVRLTSEHLLQQLGRYMEACCLP